MFAVYSQRVSNRITKILVSHIHMNTILSDEHIVRLQSTMQFLPTRLPSIVLQRVEEQFPALREIMLRAMCRCADKRILSSYSGDLYGPRTKSFLGILCFLSFYVV
jgi:hypothetical protein